MLIVLFPITDCTNAIQIINILINFVLTHIWLSSLRKPLRDLIDFWSCALQELDPYWLLLFFKKILKNELLIQKKKRKKLKKSSDIQTN